MSMNFETPPGWQADSLATDVNAGVAPPRRGRLQQTSGEFLLCRLLRKIIRTGTLHMQMPSGRRHVFGAGAPVIEIHTGHYANRLTA